MNNFIDKFDKFMFKYPSTTFLLVLVFSLVLSGVINFVLWYGGLYA